MKPVYMFDMDGTLLDLAYDDLIWNVKVPQSYMTTHDICADQTYAFIDQCYQQHQRTLRWYSTQFWSHTLKLNIFEIYKQYAEHICTRPHCIELLSQLKQKNYECWLVTNADVKTLTLKLEKTQIAPYFKHIISSEQIGYAKEDINFWHTLHTRFPFCIQDSVFIDDTTAVLHQAQQFGLKNLWSIAHPSSTGKIKPSCDYPMLEQLTDLLKFLPNPEKGRR
ncbi:HAD hydrolase-like protein [Acinetobacter sp. B5B]|nr:HAD hydrolase-like protein [Acinetobacter baretiae]